MFEVLEQSNDKVLAAHFSGKITGAEYQQFVNVVDERVKAGNPVNVVLELKGLEFYGDWAAVKQDVKFSLGEMTRLHKLAFVGDQKWIGLWTGTLGHIGKVEEKHFAEGKLGEAVEWACD